MLFILALARNRTGVFLNTPTALLGRVSFSAYLLHFIVLKVVSDQPFLQESLHESGWHAIVAFAVGLACVVLATLAGSWCMYRLIETPMINVGKVLICWRRAAVPPSVSRQDNW